jgi:hypothetical protein
MPIISQWFPEFFDRYGALTVFDLLVDYIKSNRISLDKSKIRRLWPPQNPADSAHPGRNRGGVLS